MKAKLIKIAMRMYTLYKSVLPFITNVIEFFILLGIYCIYRKWPCPKGMEEGSILWDDEDHNNGNAETGSLPDLPIYYDYGNKDTKLYYCCQYQGEWYRPITLPTDKPFYLLPYGSQNCQRVKWTTSSLEYIIYDTEDNINGDSFYRHHVYTSKNESLLKIFYCYYQGITFLKFIPLWQIEKLHLWYQTFEVRTYMSGILCTTSTLAAIEPHACSFSYY